MLGTILLVSLLFINAIAILNEERFLARIGLASTSRQTWEAAHVGYNQSGYDQAGYGDQDIGMKERLIDLISAVRTLMRIPLIPINIVFILYALVWG